MFVPPLDEGSWLWPEGPLPCLGDVQFEWVKFAPAEPLIERLPDRVAQHCAGEWYGVIHRTCDFPDAVGDARKLSVQMKYNLPVFKATKIGGLSRDVYFDQTFRRDLDSQLGIIEPRDGLPAAKFLCGLTSVQPAFEVPFPWTNEPEPIELFRSRGKRPELIFADLASIEVYLSATGECFALVDH